MSVPLSVIIPTCERHNLLEACLRSVLRHAPAGTEIIVVADGAPGKTATAFSNVRVVRLKRRRGFCAAANAGITASHGEIVELLNDDTEVTAGWADAALACFADPRVAAVAPLVISPVRTVQAGKPRIDSAGDSYDPGGFARKIGHGQRLPQQPLCRREVFGASASSAFYRRNVLLRVGGFASEFGGYFEDVDLAFRLHRTGGVVVFEPASRVLHHGGSSYGPACRRLVEQQSCNEERVWWRNMPGRDLLRSSPRHVAVLAAKAARRWREGLLAPWLCGRLRAWSEIGRHRRHERRLTGLGPPAAISTWHVAPISGR